MNVQASQSDGYADREVAKTMLVAAAQPDKRITVGAATAYDTRSFVKACGKSTVAPNLAQNTTRVGGSAIAGCTTPNSGYATSHHKRKCIEQCLSRGSLNCVMSRVMERGLDEVDQLPALTMAAYSPSRLRTLAELRSQCW